ncbi:hypothetical protein [Erythrobacter sp. SD-21]|uniref:hypothetical protein n=1 Tax=Erythrobacter sp. SD-21 TaxID=161528 RepID=UPI000153FD42|nr:hypothetical protein [Erythrobacter sp. SD-21]EDL48680.1 hypothetical protein ED21_30784 [Erythrobacter sp. SD-21]
MTSASLRLAALFPVLLAGCHGEPEPATDAIAPQAEAARSIDGQEGERLGLFSTLPIYWGEGGDVAAILEGAGEQGWVRSVLEEEGKIVPLDTLEEDALLGLDRVILAQPRPLAPSENVAFDAWVRNGGSALVFADPMLTQHSDYPLGDPRRPHDMVVLSPLLAHWGLVLRFDEGQRAGLRGVAADDLVLPVELAGHFELRGGAGGDECALLVDRLVADCRLGKGRALMVADAALLDDHEEGAARSGALRDLLLRIFPG